MCVFLAAVVILQYRKVMTNPDQERQARAELPEDEETE